MSRKTKEPGDKEIPSFNQRLNAMQSAMSEIYATSIVNTPLGATSVNVMVGDDDGKTQLFKVAWTTTRNK